MCGIAGIISTSSISQCMASKVEAMQAQLNHRGPDANGFYSAASSQAILAHTRLSIIDLSNNAAQPMSSNNGRFTITYNGEIYNYKELYKHLTTLGYKFTSQSDTEVILNLYSEYGSKCVEHLRGMFSFCIWDEVSKIAFAARDPLGIKPFYYWHNDQSLAFSSELRPLINSGLSHQSLDYSGLYSYFKTGSVSEPKTLISDIKQLQAGCYIVWEGGQVKETNYWQIDFSHRAKISYSEAIKLTRQALNDSIKAHLVSDVPISLFLSGGIDSTAILALINANTNLKVNTYSIAFEEDEWNEGPIAQRVADHFGSNHTELLLTKNKAQKIYNDYITAIDQPSIDGFNTFCISKLAHEHGEKVVLSGLGGDEVFAGYKSFELLPKMVKASKCLKLIAPAIRGFANLFTPLLSIKLRRTFDFLSEPNSLIAAHQSLRCVFSKKEASVLTPQFVNSNQGATIEGYKQDKNQQAISDKISQLELSSYMRNQLLRDSDVMSMHWGLELRVPLVDATLIDTIAVIPAEFRLKKGKQLLIDSVPEIPEWVYNRPKQGFRFPFDLWFQEQWQHPEKLDLTNKWIKLQPWYRQWSLQILTQWMKQHVK